MNWNPQNLTHCLDSVWLAWYTAITAFGMLVWYCVIAWKWNESRKLASTGGRKVWGWLIILFLVCANAGYVALDVSMFAPKTGAIARAVFLTAQNFVCPIFMYYARRYKFHLQGAYQSAGEAFITQSLEFSSMDDHAIAEVVKRMAREYLKRHETVV